MVHIPRHSPAPSTLLANKTAWTNRWKGISASKAKGDWATKKARKLLKEALRPLTYGKCAYCESILDARTEPEIEHYVAKSISPNLAFEWNNLLPACHGCNNAKGDQDHQNVLLKPDAEDPEPYFWVRPDSGQIEARDALSKAKQHRAGKTIRICGLDTGKLRDSRYLMMLGLRGLLDRVSKRTPTEDELLVFGQYLQPATPYKLVIRQVLTEAGAVKLVKRDREAFCVSRPASAVK